MTISVIIPAYNAALYVGDAIESVLAQSTPVDEIVVVDDGSTDDTTSVLAGFGSRIVSLRQTNQGVSQALNTGLGVARGDLIAFLDADDLWQPDKIALQTAVLTECPEVEAVFGQMQAFRHAQGLSAEQRQFIGGPSPGLVKGSMVIRRPAFDRVGAFDVARTNADFVDWFARAQILGLRTRMLGTVLYLRRIHSDNLGKRMREPQREAYLSIMKDVLERRRRNS